MPTSGARSSHTKSDRWLDHGPHVTVHSHTETIPRMDSNTHTQLPVPSLTTHASLPIPYPFTHCAPCLPLGLYKKVFHAKAAVHELIILILPPTTYIAHTITILLHDCCAINDSSPSPL